MANTTVASVTKVFSFDSAHSLPDYPGPCRNIHGHTYRLEVTVKGEIDVETGLVMDFYDLKRIVKGHAVGKLDHRYLNDVLPCIPTAENVAVWICRSLRDKLPGLFKIKLWETPTSFVEVFAADVRTSGV